MLFYWKCGFEARIIYCVPDSKYPPFYPVMIWERHIPPRITLLFFSVHLSKFSNPCILILFPLLEHKLSTILAQSASYQHKHQDSNTYHGEQGGKHLDLLGPRRRMVRPV